MAFSEQHRSCQTESCVHNPSNLAHWSHSCTPKQRLCQGLHLGHGVAAANKALGAGGRRYANQYESPGVASQTLAGIQRSDVRVNSLAIHGEGCDQTLREGARSSQADCCAPCLACLKAHIHQSSSRDSFRQMIRCCIQFVA